MSHIRCGNVILNVRARMAGKLIVTGDDLTCAMTLGLTFLFGSFDTFVAENSNLCHKRLILMMFAKFYVILHL